MAQESDFTYFNRSGMRDPLNALLLAVPPADLLEFCAANEAIDQVCQDDNVMRQYRAEWNQKIRQDLDYLNQNEITTEHPRLTQDLLLTNAAMIDAVDILEEYPDVLTDVNLQQPLIQAALKYSSGDVLAYVGKNSQLSLDGQTIAAYILSQCLQQGKFNLIEKLYFDLQPHLGTLAVELTIMGQLMQVNYPLADRIMSKYQQLPRQLMDDIAQYGSLESYLRHLAKINQTVEPKDRPNRRYLRMAAIGRNFPILDYYFQQNYDILSYMILPTENKEDLTPEEEEANALFIKYEAVYPGDPGRLIREALNKENRYILEYLLERYPGLDLTKEIKAYLDLLGSTEIFQQVEKQLVYDRQAMYDWAIEQRYYDVADFLAENHQLEENTDPRIEEDSDDE